MLNRVEETQERENESLLKGQLRICAVLRVKRHPRRVSGDNGEGDPPVPIPNTEVKPFSADGTWLDTARESRSPPDSTGERSESSAFHYSSVAQWQSTRLLTELL